MTVTFELRGMCGDWSNRTPATIPPDHPYWITRWYNSCVLEEQLLWFTVFRWHFTLKGVINQENCRSNSYSNSKLAWGPSLNIDTTCAVHGRPKCSEHSTSKSSRWCVNPPPTPPYSNGEHFNGNNVVCHIKYDGVCQKNTPPGYAEQNGVLLIKAPCIWQLYRQRNATPTLVYSQCTIYAIGFHCPSIVMYYLYFDAIPFPIVRGFSFPVLWI